MATIKLSPGSSCKAKLAISSNIGCFYYFFNIILNKTIILLPFVGYEMIIANLALRPSLSVYHLISKGRSLKKKNIYFSLVSGTNFYQTFTRFHQGKRGDKYIDIYSLTRSSACMSHQSLFNSI